jgi:hypothetical protein
MKKIDITGQKFGRLTVLCENGRKGKNILWRCKCECGNEIDAISYNLKNGHTQSCGYIAKEVHNKTHSIHNGSNTRLFRIWQHILKRCLSSNVKNYANYGGRGITVCDDWKDSFQTFREWSYQNGYREDLSIDRIDVNGNYEPSNCRWTNAKVQANNKRNNRLIEYNGVVKTISEWADELGLKQATIKARLDNYHWSVERALTTPQRRKIPGDIIECACGCGMKIRKYGKDGRERHFVVGHNNYVK